MFLAGHVGLGKKMPDALICQYLVVENIHSGVNGRGTTQFFIKGTHVFFSEQETGERSAPPVLPDSEIYFRLLIHLAIAAASSLLTCACGGMGMKPGQFSGLGA